MVGFNISNTIIGSDNKPTTVQHYVSCRTVKKSQTHYWHDDDDDNSNNNDNIINNNDVGAYYYYTCGCWTWSWGRRRSETRGSELPERKRCIGDKPSR